MPMPYGRHRRRMLCESPSSQGLCWLCGYDAAEVAEAEAQRQKDASLGTEEFSR